MILWAEYPSWLLTIYEAQIILRCVCWYLSYPLSYR